MTLSFPLSIADLADLLPVQSVTFMPVWQQEASGLGSGEMLVADLGPRLWEADVVLRPVPHSKARGLKARIEALDGGMNAFYLHDVLNWYPTHDPGGTILGSSTVTILAVGGDNKSLSLTGLPANYRLENDLLAIDYGTPSRRALLRMVGAVQASSGGVTALFEVRPHLRPGIVATHTVTLIKPAAKMLLLPDSLSYEMASANRTRIRFRARQTLRAG